MPLYRGSGGAIFEITPPDPGTHQRENFDVAVARGDIVLVHPELDAKPKATRPRTPKATPTTED